MINHFIKDKWKIVLFKEKDILLINKVINIKDNGKMVNLMEMVKLYIIIEICILVNFKMEKL